MGNSFRAFSRVLAAFVVCCVGALFAVCGLTSSVAWAHEGTLGFQEAADQIEAELATLKPGEDYESGAVLIKVRPNTATTEIKAVLDSSGIEGMQDVVAQRVSDELVRVELADGATVPGAVADLQLSGLVEGAQPNYVLHVLNDEPDTLAARLGLYSVEGIDDFDDEEYGTYWHLLSVNADRVWAKTDTVLDNIAGLGVTSSQTVGVATLDDSFYLQHEDLAGNVVGAYNAYAKQEGTIDNMLLLSSSHGTHVAGIIGACANNAKGAAGVSYNARIIPVRVSNNAGQIYTSTVVEAYEYIIDHKDEFNIRVANLSIGTSYPGFDGGGSYNDSLLQAIDNAYSEGIITVAAAGNGRMGAAVPIDFYPSDYGTVVSVIGLDGGSAGDTERERAQKVQRTSNSNYNSDGEADKNISAPGAAIYSTSNNGTYGYKTGTSMAAPVVSGVLALMFSADGSLTVDGAKNILYASAREVGEDAYTNHWNEEYGYGEVDAYAAVHAVQEAHTEQVVSTKRWVSGPQYLKVGDSYDYGVSPLGGSWSYGSSDEGVIAFSDARATVTGAGTAVISASGVVEGVPVEAEALSVYAFGPIKSVSALAVGKVAQASVSGPKGYSWMWESSNERVATVSSNGLVRGVSPGTAQITATLTLSEHADVEVALSQEIVVDAAKEDDFEAGVDDFALVVSKKAASQAAMAIYRLYNPNSGEHFYTESSKERDLLVALGWRDEGVGWYAPKKSSQPVYRLYNPNGGDHHYTLSSGERDLLLPKGWRYEGICWYSNESWGVPIYRQYNPNANLGAHNFTSSIHERNALLSVGWHDEGIAWYGAASKP